MNSLTFLYLLIIIGLFGTHARPNQNEENDIGSRESEESEEDDNEGGQGPNDADEEKEIMPDENAENDKDRKTKGRLVEGDVLVGDGKMRSAIATGKPWPGGTLVYRIDRGTYTTPMLYNITSAMRTIEEETGGCITFRPSGFGERNYVNFIKDGTGCFSKVGMQSGPQPLSLGARCYNTGIIIHELLHALGVNHQHTRPDRDNYVEVIWNNIHSNEVAVNFKKRIGVPPPIPYCITSIMHYGNFAFSASKNGKTLISVKNPDLKFGQRVKMQNCDILLVKQIYKCQGGKSGIPMSAPPTSKYDGRSQSSSKGSPGTGSSGSPARRVLGK